MKLTKKLNIALLLVLVCLVLVIGVSYAWLTIALNPEVQRIETNVGANGSLEIALLTAETFADPARIQTSVGDSAAKQDVVESNVSWGNVIQLGSGYGLEEITLLPARLNVTRNEKEELVVDASILRTAAFGIDGRIRALQNDTVSAVWDRDSGKPDFTYYVDGQRYGVRAIGTISNLSAQQLALASSRTLVTSYTASASRTVQNTWRSHGAALVDILYRHYALGEERFTEEDAAAVQSFADGMLEAAEYVDGAMRQALVGLAAANVADEPEFEALYEQITQTAGGVGVSDILRGESAAGEYTEQLYAYAVQSDQMLEDAQAAVTGSLYLARERSWEAVEEVLSCLLFPPDAYLGEQRLSDPDAFQSLTQDNVILLPPECGVMGEIADFTGNFSAFATWKDNISMEARTASTVERGILLGLQAALESVKAASGGWTRANMDDLYGLAVDMAFRCNVASSLQLQTGEEMRLEGASEYPVMQGSGSFMQFYSDNMDTDRLITLMDTIRVGFLSDSGELLGIAKLNLSNCVEEEGKVSAPLYLYEFELEENGQIAVIRRSDDAVIRELPQNAPVTITVVVWLDGDAVDNSMVSELAHQSMSGVLSLQFSGSADLVPSEQLIERD